MTYEENQKLIQQNVEDKKKREEHTQKSILVSWAINNAVNCLGTIKRATTDEVKQYEGSLEKWANYFISLYKKMMKEQGEDKSLWQKLHNEESQRDDDIQQNLPIITQ